MGRLLMSSERSHVLKLLTACFTCEFALCCPPSMYLRLVTFQVGLASKCLIAHGALEVILLSMDLLMLS